MPAIVPGTSLIQTTARFGWREDGKPKWAWPVQWVEAYQQPLPPGFRAGIRYARAVEILRPSAALLDMLARWRPPGRYKACPIGSFVSLLTR